MRNLSSNDRVEMARRLREGSQKLGRTALLARWGFIVQLYPIRGYDRGDAQVWLYDNGATYVFTRDGFREVRRGLTFNLG